MLIVREEDFTDSMIAAWPRLLPEGALVVVNDTRVFKARLLGNRYPSGGRVELLLLRAIDAPPLHPTRQLWNTMGRSNRPLSPGSVVQFQSMSARVVERLPAGELVVELESDEPIDTVVDRIGHVPIPPYLGRSDEPSDIERYQTLFAQRRGSIAAPTAGLHLSNEILSELSSRNIVLEYLTLHVGIGTFRPVVVDELDAHPMHSETFEVTEGLVAAVDAARARRANVIAVGTTVVRALESAAELRHLGSIRAKKGLTNLLIQPGYTFNVVDGLLTNFHMPRSTLLALVGAFAGLDRTLEAYRVALQRNYRFLSYGDAMWIPRRI